MGRRGGVSGSADTVWELFPRAVSSLSRSVGGLRCNRWRGERSPCVIADSGVLLRPYSTHPDTHFATNDLDVFKIIGERGTELTGYPAVSVFHNFAYDPKEPMHGAMDDYAFDFYGWFGFTAELWDAPTAAGLDMKNDWKRIFAGAAE